MVQSTTFASKQMMNYSSQSPSMLMGCQPPPHPHSDRPFPQRTTIGTDHTLHLSPPPPPSRDHGAGADASPPNRPKQDQLTCAAYHRSTYLQSPPFPCREGEACTPFSVFLLSLGWRATPVPTVDPAQTPNMMSLPVRAVTAADAPGSQVRALGYIWPSWRL